MLVRDNFHVFLLVIAVLATGCANQSKYARFQPLPRGTNLYVIAVDPEIAAPDAKTAGETVGKEAAKGASVGLAGGLGGGFYLSILCGPAIVVCAPILVPAGAAVGLVGGTAMGAGQAGLKALPKEKADALERVMSDALQEIDFLEALHGTFVARSGNRWNLSSDAEAVNVTLGLEALNLTQLEDDVLVFNFTASMIVRYGPGEGQTTRRFLFSHNSDRRPVDDFLEDNGERFREEITTAFQMTIDEMIRALDYESNRQPAR